MKYLPRHFILRLFLICGAFMGAHAQETTFEWSLNGLGEGDDRGFKLCTDPRGNVIMIGRYHSKSIRFGETVLFNANQDSSSSDVILTKHDPNGNLIWGKSIGGLGDEFGTDCKTDQRGNIYIVYTFDREIVFDGITFTNHTIPGAGDDIMLAKLTPDGKLLWAKQIGGEKHDGGYVNCVVDSASQCYVSGVFYSSLLDFGEVQIKNSKNRGCDIFLAKYSAAGALDWAISTKGTDTADSGQNSLEIDPEQNPIISGWYQGGYIVLDKDTLRLNNEASNSTFIASFTPNGKLNRVYSENAAFGNQFKIDDDGNWIFAGAFGDSLLTLGDKQFLNHGEADIFIAKFTPNAEMLWAKTSGGTDVDLIRNFCLDAQGNIIVTGTYNSPTWQLDNYTLTKDTINVSSKVDKRTTEDMFIASFSPYGEIKWAHHSGGKSRNAGRHCTTDSNNNIYVTGSFDVNEFKLGKTTLKNAGDSDLFIAKLSAKSKRRNKRK